MSHDGGPAFPVTAENGLGHVADGMSLRDWFAGQALTGICANAEEAKAMRNVGTADTINIYVDASYRIADAMLAWRQKEGA